MASRLAAIAAISLAVVAAGCGGAGSGSNAHGQAPASTPAAVAARARASASAPCRTRLAPLAERRLPSASPPRYVRLTGSPFGIATSPDGRWTFVSSVFRGRGALTLLRGLRPVRTVALPSRTLGLAISADGRMLVGASPDGLLLIDARAVERGSSAPRLGSVAVPGSGSGSGGGSEVQLSADGRFAYESLEYRGEVAVFVLGPGRPRFLGATRVGVAPLGMALSPDGSHLYVTSEAAGGRLGAPPSHGTLSVLDTARAERAPARAVAARVSAGCSPVRVAVTPDGATVWLTSRAGDELLGFSAAKLLSDPADALTAAVHVGAAPLGLSVVRGGREILIADSAFAEPGARTGLTLVSAAAALSGRQAVLGEIAAGGFPRQVYARAGTSVALIANYGSGQLEIVRLAGLP